MVVDELVVELGLDPSKFNQNQRAALESFKRTQEAARAGAKDIEESGGKVSDALGGIKTQALQMFAAIAGGKGILEFSANLTNADAALGRLERNIGVSASTVSAWQGAARIFGGDAKQMAQSFTTVSDAFAGWKIGMVTPLIADLRAISTAGGTVIDVNKGVEQSFMDLSANLKAIHDRDPAQAGLLGRKIGLDPALFDLMIRGPTGVKEVLDYIKKIGVATRESTDAFGELEKRMGQIGAKAESLGREVLVGEEGKGGLGSVILEIADVLNMKEWSAAWDYLNRTDRMALRRGEKKENGAPGQPMFSAPDAGGAFKSLPEKEAFIRAEATRRGMDPSVAMAVAKSEGFFTFNSTVPGEKSYGAFQLNISKNPNRPSLGDRFKKDTGLDPADHVNERRGIQYALDEARKVGWGQWYGARNTGISTWAGIPQGGASSTTTTEVNINGPITVTPPAGADAEDFAGRFVGAVRRQSAAAQSNGGQN